MSSSTMSDRRDDGPPRDAGNITSAPPVFIMARELPEDTTIANLCNAAEKLSGFGSIVGCQRLGNIYRLIPAKLEFRAMLAGKKISIKGSLAEIFSKNPLLMRNVDGEEVPTTKIIIDLLPVSIYNADVEGTLKKMGVVPRSPLMWEKARADNGQLTRWITGRRFIWANVPTSTLPKRFKVGTFTASLYYKEQPKTPLKCFDCNAMGHRRGDPSCNGRRAEAWGPRVPSFGDAEFPALAQRTLEERGGILPPWVRGAPHPSQTAGSEEAGTEAPAGEEEDATEGPGLMEDSDSSADDEEAVADPVGGPAPGAVTETGEPDETPRSSPAIMGEREASVPAGTRVGTDLPTPSRTPCSRGRPLTTPKNDTNNKNQNQTIKSIFRAAGRKRSESGTKRRAQSSPALDDAHPSKR